MNYNQVVKELHTHFSQKKALAMLYKLENETRNLVAVGEKIIALTDEFRKQWQKQKAKEAFLRRIERQWQIMPPQYWQSSM